MKITNFKPAALAAYCGIALLAGLFTTGCRGDREDAPPRQFFPDLDDQLKWKPQTGSEFFADGRTMRPAVPGAVAFGRTSFVPAATGPDWNATYVKEREQLLRNDPEIYEGRQTTGKLVVKIPVPVSMGMIQTGQQKYNIYCASCHGYLGDGLGQVGLQWATPVANFHDVKYQEKAADNGEKWTDGHLFRTGMFGYYDEQQNQKMPGYAHALSAEDAWSVVAYIRALQASRANSLDAVPADQRPALDKLRASVLSPPAASDSALASTGGAQ